MTTEPVTDSSNSELQDPPSADENGAPTRSVPRHRRWNPTGLEEGLRRGRVRRLRPEPSTVLTRIVGSLCSDLQVHNRIAAAQLELRHPRWRLTPEGAIELDLPSGDAAFEPGIFRNVFADPSTARMAAVDERGELLVEWNLENWAPANSSRRESSSPDRASRSEPRLTDVEIHATSFEREVCADAWRKCDTFRETARLERGPRRDRASLLETLPRPYARTVPPSSFDSLLDELSEYGGSLHLELEGTSYRLGTTLRNFELRSAGEIALLHSDAFRAILDRTGIGEAHVVTLPGRGALVRALEFVDPDGGLAARLRRTYEAPPGRIFAWRAILDRSRRGR